MKSDRSHHIHRILLWAALIALASQISVALQDNGFHISVAVVLFQVLLFLSPELPVLPVALLAAPAVFLLQLAVHLISGGTLTGCWNAYAPEMLFYLVYGVLFSLLARRSRPFRFALCLPLAAIDALSNLTELLVRTGIQTSRPDILGQILAVGTGRALLAWLAVRALDSYGIRLLHREDSERYRHLLLMTAALKGEVVWMDKGTVLVEGTMNKAYQLYRRLRSSGAAQDTVDAALTIAKDIHEVKKEYALVMRGISEALDQDPVRQGMDLQELLLLLARSTRQLACATGKDMTLDVSCTAALRTGKHYELMSIFRNLLTNAVEAAQTDRPTHLYLDARWKDSVLCCWVEDDCGGIPEDRIQQIFPRGFSSKIDRETGEINRGLGLAIVKDLVENRLGGTVAVQSEGGRTAFTVRIPRTNLEEEQDAALSD